MGKDLRDFIGLLEKQGPKMFRRVKKEVDPKYEVSAVTQKIGGGILDLGERPTPALLFENVRGSKMPVITNLFATRKHIALALGVDESEIVKKFLDAEKSPIEPKTVSDGPVKEVVQKGDQVDLNRLPIITHCEKDVGPFITAGVLLAKDPDSGYVNFGIYRHMLKGKNKLGVSLAPQHHGAHIFRKKEAKGEDLECAIAVGHHPAVIIAGVYEGAFGVSELAIAGAFLNEPLEMVRCETVNLEVPAYSEIVIEGKIRAGIREDDAPFGEYLGYYGDDTIKRPVIEVTCITHRRDALFHDIYNSGIEHPLLGAVALEAEVLKRVRLAVPQVTDVRVPNCGVTHLAYVQLKKGYEGSGKNAALAALTMPYIKTVVVVDDDIDIGNDSKVLWAILTRTDPDRSIFFIPEASVSRLDPMSYTLYSRGEKGTLSTKVGIDATKPLGYDFPELALPPKDLLERINLADYLTGYSQS